MIIIESHVFNPIYIILIMKCMQLFVCFSFDLSLNNKLLIIKDETYVPIKKSTAMSQLLKNIFKERGNKIKIMATSLMRRLNEYSKL